MEQKKINLLIKKAKKEMQAIGCYWNKGGWRRPYRGTLTRDQRYKNRQFGGHLITPSARSYIGQKAAEYVTDGGCRITAGTFYKVPGSSPEKFFAGNHIDDVMKEFAPEIKVGGWVKV